MARQKEPERDEEPKRGQPSQPKASQRTHGKYSGSRSDSSSVSKRTSGYKGKTRAKKGARGR